MISQHDIDCAALYKDVRREFVELLRPLSTTELDRNVAPTPAWSVRDVLAHLVGIAADLNAGNFGGLDDGDQWTAAQVESRRGRTIDELGDEWAREAVQFEEGLRLLGYEIGSHYLGDLLQHVSDVRSTLGVARIDDDAPALIGATDFYVDSFHEALVEAGIGGVALVVGRETFRCGAGNQVASLAGGRFEIFRALGGRRSERQIRALHWTGDFERVLPALSRYPLPATDI